jgi:signal peptidase I
MQEQRENLIFFKIKGTSMRPFFKTGDMFIVKRTTAGNLKIGDIISYYSEQNKSEVCHRLIKKMRKADGYLLYVRGDACFNPVEQIEEGASLGKVIAVVRNERIVDLTRAHQRFINRFMVAFAPTMMRIYDRILSLAPNLSAEKQKR